MIKFLLCVRVCEYDIVSVNISNHKLLLLLWFKAALRCLPATFPRSSVGLYLPLLSIFILR